MELNPQDTQITGLADALGIGLELAAYYKYGHFTLILNEKNKLLTLAIFDQPTHTIFDAILYTQNLRNSEAGKVLHFSLIQSNPDHLQKTNLEIYQWAESKLSELNIQLLDWIEINQELYRSYAQTIKPNQAWR